MPLSAPVAPKGRRGNVSPEPSPWVSFKGIPKVRELAAETSARKICKLAKPSKTKGLGEFPVEIPGGDFLESQSNPLV